LYGCDTGDAAGSGAPGDGIPGDDITSDDITVSGIQVYGWGKDYDNAPVTFNGNAPINYEIIDPVTFTTLDVQSAGEITYGKLNLRLPSAPPQAMQRDISSLKAASNRRSKDRIL
jgi:hypothetical protein